MARVFVFVKGFLKRKVLRKQNKSVSLAHRKIKYWVQLTDSSLVLQTSRPKPKKSVSFTRTHTCTHTFPLPVLSGHTTKVVNPHNTHTHLSLSVSPRARRK